MDPPLTQQRQQLPALERHGLREIISLGVAPRPTHQPVEQQLRHIDQHQTGQDFIGPEAVLQSRWNSREHRPAETTKHQHHNQRQRRLPGGEIDRDRRTEQRPDRQLSLGADIPNIGGIANRQPRPDQHQGRRLDDQFLDRPERGYRLNEVDVERLGRVEAEAGEDDPSGHHGDRDRQQRRQQRHRPGALTAFFQDYLHGAAAVPPA